MNRDKKGGLTKQKHINNEKKTNYKKYIKIGDITSVEYDKTVKTKCYCNSDYWCQLCDGDFELFD